MAERNRDSWKCILANRRPTWDWNLLVDTHEFFEAPYFTCFDSNPALALPAALKISNGDVAPSNHE